MFERRYLFKTIIFWGMYAKFQGCVVIQCSFFRYSPENVPWMGIGPRICDSQIFGSRSMALQKKKASKKEVLALERTPIILVISVGWVVFSNIFYFHPENWGRFPFWLICFKGVGSTTNSLASECWKVQWWELRRSWPPIGGVALLQGQCLGFGIPRFSHKMQGMAVVCGCV